MNIEAAVKGRRSIRKFLNKDIPEVIRDILEAARWSPSWGNTVVEFSRHHRGVAGPVQGSESAAADR